MQLQQGISQQDTPLADLGVSDSGHILPLQLVQHEQEEGS